MAYRDALLMSLDDWLALDDDRQVNRVIINMQGYRMGPRRGGALRLVALGHGPNMRLE